MQIVKAVLISFLVVITTFAGCIGDESSEEVTNHDTSNLEERIELLEDYRINMIEDAQNKANDLQSGNNESDDEGTDDITTSVNYSNKLMYRADFRYANLNNADMSYSNFSHGVFFRAQLRNADLRGPI